LRVFKFGKSLHWADELQSRRISNIASIFLAELDNPAPGFDWVRVRHGYEVGRMTIKALCTKYGVTADAIQQERERSGWRRRRIATPNRSSLINRMFRLLDRQITQLEETMAKSGDKEVAVLGNLARTLEKLIEIDDAEQPKRSTKAHSKDMQDIRRKLEKRIDDLTKG
jgi:hypothetical protein